MEKALYAYFGEIGLFTDDIPGHSFYQVGLLDAISEHFGIEKFDFYNYLEIQSDEPNASPQFLDDPISRITKSFANVLIDQYRISYDTVLANISGKMYSKLFLKARFRNLSTLAKKIRDAHRFEEIIQLALSKGFEPANIIVLDTDLSMSGSFRDSLARAGVQIMIPSIDFPGIGQNYLDACMVNHKTTLKKRSQSLIYYGNVDFTNYKKGHEKNPIIFDIIKQSVCQVMFDQTKFHMILAAKDSPKIQELLSSTKLSTIEFVPRTDRAAIWKALTSSLVSINVSKDLYLEKGFTPARVYESIIAGAIPVSYKKGQMEAMTFETYQDFYEIAKFLAECTPEEYYGILDNIASSL